MEKLQALSSLLLLKVSSLRGNLTFGNSIPDFEMLTVDRNLKSKTLFLYIIKTST